ncbi:MAG: hypothetical protein K0R26_2008 [Bacteroidota bacterium]|jgi:hypothetical protein|nr:hypothetical protein [Bacteroidota bacterium]
MQKKLIIYFNDETESTISPVYPLIDVSTEDYIKFEFGDAYANSYFDVRVTFKSIVEGEYIQVILPAMANSVYEFYIKDRLADESSQNHIKSEVAYIECAPVKAKFRITVYEAE